MSKSLYVREMTEAEVREIRELAASDSVKTRQRAAIMLLSRQYHVVREIAREVNLHEQNVRKWIKRFNKEGVEGIFSDYSNCGPGSPYTDEQKKRIRKMGATKPRSMGLPFSRWSLAKLRDYVVAEGIVDTISIETVRHIRNGD